MKRIFLSVLSLVLATAMVVPGAAAVAAQPETEAVEVLPVARPSLVIRAPGAGDVGQPVTITVLAKHNYKPVAQAAVYALKTDELAITADSNNYTTVAADYAALAKERGIFIGYTNNEGAVTHRFSDTGRYILVAIKDGYVPGFSRITTKLAASKGLRIRIPSAAEVGEPVTITVVERYSYEPVANAAVYARKIGEINVPEVISVVPSDVTDTMVIKAVPSVAPNTMVIRAVPSVPTDTMVIRAGTAPSADEVQYAVEIEESGIFIGYTNNRGQVVHRFGKTGRYVLAALKDNYAPGIAKISITLANQRMLGIKAPRTAEVGRPVTITVVERYAQEPVAKAGVYALKIGEIVSSQPVEETPQAEVDYVAEAEKTAALVREKGVSVGYTDRNGEVVHSFDETGRYLLVAIKDGYTPGFTYIAITLALHRALAIEAPDEADVGRPVRIAVKELHTNQPVAQASIYALKVEGMDEAIRLILRAAKGDFASVVEEQGAFIGSTGDDGVLVHRFDQAGHYILMATKDGYVPDFAGVYVKPLGIAYPEKIDAVRPGTGNSNNTE